MNKMISHAIALFDWRYSMMIMDAIWTINNKRTNMIQSNGSSHLLTRCPIELLQYSWYIYADKCSLYRVTNLYAGY